jgi:hypothetical protein
LSLLIAVPCRSRPRRRAEPFTFTFAFARVATRTRRTAPSCTPARARVDPGGKTGSWSPLSSRVGLAATLRTIRTATASPWSGRSRSRSHRRGTPPL